MDAKRIGEKLKELRGSRSRNEIAFAMGVSLSTYQMWENGARIPRDYQKLALARYFGVPVGELFFEDDNT